MLGLAGQGVHPLVLGDLKGEHVDAVQALGGQVPLGRGRGYLNILDPGQAVEAARLLEEQGHHDAAVRVRADAHGRRLAMVVSLITISRNNPPTDQEQTILDRALRVLDDTFDGIPVLKDLLDVITAAPDELRQDVRPDGLGVARDLPGRLVGALGQDLQPHLELVLHDRWQVRSPAVYSGPRPSHWSVSPSTINRLPSGNSAWTA